MPPKIKPEKTFPAAEEKLVLIASLKGDSIERRILVDFDDDLKSNAWHIIELTNYAQWLATGPKGQPPSADIQVLADLKTGELEGIRGRDREKYYNFFEPAEKRRGGARVYDITQIHYFGMTALPRWMNNEEE